MNLKKKTTKELKKLYLQLEEEICSRDDSHSWDDLPEVIVNHLQNDHQTKHNEWVMDQYYNLIRDNQFDMFGIVYYDLEDGFTKEEWLDNANYALTTLKEARLSLPFYQPFEEMINDIEAMIDECVNNEKTPWLVKGDGFYVTYNFEYIPTKHQRIPLDLDEATTSTPENELEALWNAKTDKGE